MKKEEKTKIKNNNTSINYIDFLSFTKPIIYATAITLILLSSKQVKAEQSQNLIYNKPSTEMDFELPKVPSISENPESTSDSPAVIPPRPIEDPTNAMDNFFSSAPITPEIITEMKIEQDTPASIDIPIDDEDFKDIPPIINTIEDKTESRKKPVNKWWKKPKIKFVKNKNTKHQFHTQKLPATIYKRKYSNDNKHLPKAWYKHDMVNAMTLAVERGDIKTMRSLRKAGINVNRKDYNGEPLLTHAIRFGALNSVEWLLIHGANVSEISKDGVAPLHLAAYSGNQALMTRLLDHGANPNQLDAHGVSPLIYAQKGRVPESVQILYEYGATSQTAYLE